MKRAILLVAFVAPSVAAPSVAAPPRAYVAPVAGAAFLDRGRQLDDAAYVGGRAGVRAVGPLWLEVAGGRARTRGCAADDRRTWSHWSGGLAVGGPVFASAAVGRASVGVASETVVEGAVGVNARLNRRLALRLEARDVYWPKARDHDVVASAGLSLRFGGTSAAATAVPAASAAVAPSPAPASAVPASAYVLPDVHFDFDASAVRPEDELTLQTVGEILVARSWLRIEIAGHTDSRGSDAYNLQLSLRRANAVHAWLLRRFPGLAPVRISAAGYGESRPVVPELSPAHEQANRRVEFLEKP